MDLTIYIYHKWPILVYLTLALAISRLPYLRIYFSLCNTLIHEVIRVLLQGGISKKIYLKHRQTITEPEFEQSQIKHSLLTYAWYSGASLSAIGLFYLVSKQNYHLILYSFIGLLAISMLLWIRNFFGFVWAISFIGVLGLPIYLHNDIVVMHISVFFASSILVHSILNGIVLCSQTLTERKTPARTGIFAKVRLIPALMFGGVLLVQSIYTGYFILKNIV